MPEPITPPPADGPQGTGAPAAPAAAPTGQPPETGAPPKTFTQAELDVIIQDRLKRAVPADYEELKALADKQRAAEEADKTELQKATDKAARAEAKAEAAIANANATLIRASILAEAGAANAVDADTVVALLAGNADITIDKDGNVSGAKEAVKALLKDKPFLAKAATPGRSGAEFGGSDPKDKAARIADLEAKANDPKSSAQERQRYYQEARALKLG